MASGAYLKGLFFCVVCLLLRVLEQPSWEGSGVMTPGEMDEKSEGIHKLGSNCMS